MTHPYAQPLADLFRHLIPEMVLVLFACVLFVGGLFKADRRLWGGVALAALALAFLTLLFTPASPDLGKDAVFAVPMLFDPLAQLTRILALATGFVFILLCWHEMPEKHVADHHACLLVISAGVGLVGCSNDLVTLFLALELTSIPTYIMLYLPRHDDGDRKSVV